jgi:uncharacterized membrane protein (DUF4010 family)
METIPGIPKSLVDFILVTVFALLIGLSQRRIHAQAHETDRTVGTDRTFTFIGIFGFILYILDPVSYRLFIGGGLAVAAVLVIYYYAHIRDFKDYGGTTVFVALITYCLGPVVADEPRWMGLLLVVTVLVLTEMKETFGTLSAKFGRDEFITLAKFLIIAGVILPIVPDRPFIPNINLTPYKVWLAVVVISSISYVSYLLQKFVFKSAGIVLSAILGGLYSSTATTIILARKSKEEPALIKQYMAGIFMATAMMYLRILILILIFNPALFGIVWPWFLSLFAFSAGVGLFFLYFRREAGDSSASTLPTDKNPLEFKVALIFTSLYVAFTLITFAVLNRYGTPGLNVLSYLVGLTDIDPFLIGLFQGKFSVTPVHIAIATLQAVISNNFAKMCYGCFFAGRKAIVYLLSGFLLIIAATILFMFFI